MKNIPVILILLALLTASAYAKNIEIIPSENSISMNAGNTMISTTLTVKNNQDKEQTVSFFGGGLFTVSFSPSVLNIPANSQGQTLVYINSPNDYSGDYDLTLTASSLGGNDPNTTDTKTITIKIPSDGTELRGIHKLISLGQTAVDPKMTVLGMPITQQKRIHLTLNYDPKLSNRDGQVIKDGDDVCTGDTINISTQNSGNVMGDGGPTDDPEVVFVDDLQKVAKDIESGKFKPILERTPLCNYMMHCPEYFDESPEQMKEANKYFIQAGFPSIDDLCECLPEAAFICESKCNGNTAGTGQADGGYYVRGAGRIEVDINCEASCMAYYDNGSFTMMPLADAGEGNAVYTQKYFLNAVNDTRQPDLKILGYTHNDVNGKTDVKASIENTGDVIAYVDKVSVNKADAKVLYRPKTIMPGAKDDIIIEAGNNAVDLKVDISYSTEKTGCLKNKNFWNLYSIGACKTDKDCDDGNMYTEDLCINPGTDDSHCVNSRYEKINPASAYQTYQMDVQGSCSNKYYTCYQPEKTSSPDLYAGDKCYNTGNNYYTNSLGRFLLKYDISALNKGLTISRAILTLQAKNVNKAQTIEVSAVGDNWDDKSCISGGDICTQPYCGECSAAHDIAGKSLTSQQVKDTTLYSFDITDYLKDKYGKGERFLSMQIKGAEEEGFCNTIGDWTRQDIEFDPSPTITVLY